MKKKTLTTTLRPQYKEMIIKLSKELGLSIGQTIECLLDIHNKKAK